MTFFKINFFKKLIISLSNGLDLDQDQHFVGPDLGPNCLQWYSADKHKKIRVKKLGLS